MCVHVSYPSVSKKELSDYVPELRTLHAAMQLNILAEEVKGKSLWKDSVLRSPRRKFRVHPWTFEEALGVAFNAEFNFKTACYDIQCQNLNRDEPMDLAYAEDEAELHAAEQQRNIRRCYM